MICVAHLNFTIFGFIPNIPIIYIVIISFTVVPILKELFGAFYNFTDFFIVVFEVDKLSTAQLLSGNYTAQTGAAVRRGLLDIPLHQVSCIFG